MMEDKALIIEQEYEVPKDLVWRAITDPELMKKWYFDISGFQLEVGCQFQFDGGEEGKRYTHLCEILEVIPHEKLKYSWAYEGHEGISFVTFDLLSQEETTKLTKYESVESEMLSFEKGSMFETVTGDGLTLSLK